ncbi:hypothetical protein PIB30_078765, partial [Stylosanthes scabra]|nr:hypothetical protein [Stylosanthes scabra]
MPEKEAVRGVCRNYYCLRFTHYCRRRTATLLSKVNRCMARLQELQYTVTDGSK